MTAAAPAWNTQNVPASTGWIWGAAAGLAVCYACGSVWYAVSAGVPYLQSLLATVVPFVGWDALKAVLAGSLAAALRVVLKKTGMQVTAG